MKEVTDWDAYYHKPAAMASLTRTMTQRKIARLLSSNVASGPRVCEIGGGNSCVLNAVCTAIKPSHYHVIDNNAVGLSLLPEAYQATPVSSTQANVLNRTEMSGEGVFDVVFSIGLIEHFDVQNTAIAIASHFDLCRKGGLVLITFPTPTLPYRLIRYLSESLNLWHFPDERPLGFDEVRGQAAQHGAVLHQSINWWIGLTQGYILIKKQ